MSKPDSFVIRLSSGRTLHLREGTKLSAEDILNLEANVADGAVAAVSRHPKDPAVLGLENLSRQAWSATVPGGGQKQVAPGRSIKLADGTAINFGQVAVSIQEGARGFLLSLSSGAEISLRAGVRLTASDLLSPGGSSAGGAAAEVVRNPTDKAVLGLRNQSSQDWAAVVPGGGQQRVAPGRSIRLAVGTKISFGVVEGEIQGNTPPTSPADARPYFDARLANPSQASTRSAPGQNAGAGKQERRKLWPYILGGGVLLAYSILTWNPTALLVGIGLVWAMHRFGNWLDTLLALLWPFRDKLSSRVRTILAWVVPLAVANVITGSPTLFNWFTWLPFIGPDASVFTLTTILSGLIAYVLIREPQTGGTR